jgi:hypothetical protein
MLDALPREVEVRINLATAFDCPFAPGTTDNIATENVVWMFQRMGMQPA